jgi:hypothetical protein
MKVNFHISSLVAIIVPMDQDDLQLQQGSAPSNDAPSDVSTPNVAASNQIFDISEDNISPISSEDFAVKPVTSAPQSASIAEPIEMEKRSTPPPEEELLDQKIGTFDATPFAPPVQRAAPSMPDVRPTSSPQAPSAPVVGLYPTRPPQNAPAPTEIKPAMRPTQPYREPLESQPSFQQVRPAPISPIAPKKPAPIPPLTQTAPVTPTIQRARSLQDEISAALPANLRGVQMPRPQAAPASAPIQTAQPIRQAQSQQQNQSAPESAPREVIKPVRTYEGDVAEAMSHKRTSTASIAIAESKRQQQSETISNDEAPSHAGRKIAMLIVSLLLLGGGAYGAYYLYSKSALAPVTPIVQQQKAAPSIIPSDSQSVVTISNQSPVALRQRLANEINKTQAPNTITELVLATKDAAGTLTRIPAPTMVANLDINAPDILTRSLTANWMLGVYNDPDNKKSVFVVVTTSFFQNAFAGMLQWEHVMADDLRQYLYPDSVSGISNGNEQLPVPVTENVLKNIDSILPTIGTTTATTTKPVTSAKATSTPKTKTAANATSTTPTASSTPEVVAPLKSYLTVQGKFEDRIVKNKDVRAFRTNTGTILFLYSFIDNTHLVVTDKESTLAEILSRLEKQSFIR